MIKKVIYYKEFLPILDLYEYAYESFGLTQEFRNFFCTQTSLILDCIDIYRIPIPHQGEKRTRTVVGSLKVAHYNFQVVLTRWNECKIGSPIHCHPKFTGYLIKQGLAVIQPYRPLKKDIARPDGSVHIMMPGDSFFNVGEFDKQGNALHQLRYIQQDTIIIHLYSDNNVLCQEYEEVIINKK